MTAPTSRNEFEIAIICALPREYNAVSLTFDEVWATKLGRATGDENTYKTGRIGEFNVVLFLLPNMGKVGAAAATANLRSSFPEVKLGLVTGICGGAPGAKALDNQELLLGDVIVGTTLVQYDLGRRNISGFAMKGDIESSLGRGAKVVRNLVNRLRTDDKDDIADKAAEYLLEIQKKQAGARKAWEKTKYKYPGSGTDKLFHSRYHHKHNHQPCETCSRGLHEVCHDALEMSCQELNCDESHLVTRERLVAIQDLDAEAAQRFEIFVGRIGSGDTVMKSGEERDSIARKHDLVAFEMEGAGVVDELPCIVIKGVCDYADSHKNKLWQDFAAATAASVAKALVDQYPKTDKAAAAGERPSGLAKAGTPTAIFHGPVTGRNVIAGNTITGGEATYNFN